MTGNEEMRFDGQVVVITGAGRGIGRVQAHALAERGAKLVINDFGGSLAGSGSDPGLAQIVVEELKAAGAEAVANVGDVSTQVGAESVIEEAISSFGKVDVVINNAGILAPDDIPSLEVDDLKKHLDVHVVGSYNVTRAAWPHMEESGFGRVVMTSSIGLMGGANLIAYSTAKGGVMSLGRSLALAGEGKGITVNVVLPVAETRMVNDPSMRAKAGLPLLDDTAKADPSRGPELTTQMVVLLAHRQCPVNGEMFETGLGRTAWAFIGETKGVFDLEHRAEDLLDALPEIMDEDGYMVHRSTAAAIESRERLIAKVRAAGG